MSSDSIKGEFSVRYYYWALEDFKREIKQGFPHLKQFKSGLPYWVMDMMSDMTLDEQQMFAGALVKRFHKEAVQAAGHNFTAEEKELCDQYRARALGLTPTELDMRNKQLTSGLQLRPNRKLLRNMVKTELKRLNMILPTNAARGLNYHTHIDDWNILTHVDTERAHAQLMYSHHIYSIDEFETVVGKRGEAIRLPITMRKHISLNSWLGIGSETAWFDLTELEFDQAAKQLAKLCSHFFEAAPTLLKGL